MTFALSRFCRCPLTVLSLERADVDDDECVSLVGEIHRNRKSMLRSLNVARNFIGERESRNVVQPEFVTGAEAIAEWLGSRACVLRALDISWNMIRGDSAVQLGEALATNDSLQHLSVAYNGIGREGGSALGFSLFQNSTLRKLDVSHNSISPSAAYTFAIAIARPRALESIDLSGSSEMIEFRLYFHGEILQMN
jgi:Ran GTPase-activating protein (RanGAP) involved in mRNA processing and transport